MVPRIRTRRQGSRQASAEHFQQCAEFALFRNRGLGPLAVTVLPVALTRRAAATLCAAVQSTAPLFRRWRPAGLPALCTRSALPGCLKLNRLRVSLRSAQGHASKYAGQSWPWPCTSTSIWKATARPSSRMPGQRSAGDERGSAGRPGPHHDLRSEERRHLYRRVSHGRRRVACAISVPAGETRVLKHFQARMPYGLVVPDIP